RARRRDPALAVVPPGAVALRQRVRRVRARHRGARRHRRLSRVSRRHAESHRLLDDARQGLRVPARDGVPRAPMGWPHRRAADRLHRPGARLLEDDLAGRRRGAAPRHVVGDSRPVPPPVEASASAVAVACSSTSPLAFSSWYSASTLTFQTSLLAPKMFSTDSMAVYIEWSWLLYLCIPFRPTG